MGNQPHIAADKPDSKHAHTHGASTQPEDSHTNQSTDAPAQGEHIPAPTSLKDSTKLVRTGDRSEHTHRPELPAAPPAAPQNRSVLADTSASRRTTRRQASASTQPYEHMVLDSDRARGKFHRVLWTQALDTLHSLTNESICDPEAVYTADTTPFHIS
jgi:hypothetical protein